MSSSSRLVPYVLAELPYSVAQMAVLDCGCGYGRWGRAVRSRRGGREAFVVGSEIFERYALASRLSTSYDELVLCDIRRVPFRHGSFDLVLACEVIEHMDKQDGIRFLRHLKLVAKRRVIVTTPNGYYPQGAADENIFQVHRSTWSVSDLRKLDFRVKGVGLFIVGPPSTLPSIVRRPLWLVAEAFARISELGPIARLLKIFPRIGAFLLSVGDR